MQRHIETELEDLKQQILSMGGLVEKAIEESTQALLDRAPQRLDAVYQYEAKINESHVAVDNSCVSLLARQSPFAADLRLVIAVIKINSDLERMGDQAVNITNNARRYLQDAPLKPLVDLPEMAKQVKVMVRESLDAFVRQDVELAQHVLERDDVVDDFKDQIFRDVLDIISKNPKQIEQGLDLILIARNLERLGDHATNIAEDVIFAITGEDVRHKGHAEKKA